MTSRFHLLSSDVLTSLFQNYFTTQSRYAVLAAFPDLAGKVKWIDLYNAKYDALSLKLRDLHDRFFTITKRQRIAAMKIYYDHVSLGEVNDSDDDDDDYDFRQIPIVEDNSHCELQDYIYSFEDDIYDDIKALKKWETRANL